MYDLIGTLEGEDDLGVLVLMMRADRYRWLTALGALLDAACEGYDTSATAETLAVRDALRAGTLDAPWAVLAQAAAPERTIRGRVAYFFGMAALAARNGQGSKAEPWLNRAVRDLATDNINIRAVALPAWQAHRRAE